MGRHQQIEVTIIVEVLRDGAKRQQHAPQLIGGDVRKRAIPVVVQQDIVDQEARQEHIWKAIFVKVEPRGRMIVALDRTPAAWVTSVNEPSPLLR